MRIGIVSSMHHAEKMREVMERLRAVGHDVFASRWLEEFIGKGDEEKERLKLDKKYTRDAIRDFWNEMQGADAILVVNFERHGVKDYIGGNTLMEIGFAHVLGQKIFFYNPIPDIPYYKSELEAVKPVIINGDLSLIR